MTKKGYALADFTDSFGRYLNTPNLRVTTSQPTNNLTHSDFTSVTHTASVTDRKAPQPFRDEECDAVTDKTKCDDTPSPWSEAI